MLSHLKTILGAIAFMLSLGGFAGEAKAQTIITVTVGGVDYDISYVTSNWQENNGTDVFRTTGILQPWWGNSSLATQFATAWNASPLSGGVVSATNDPLSFAYNENSSGPGTVFTQDANGNGVGTVVAATKGFQNDNVTYAFVLIPEIDGGALSQAAFVLLAFGLLLAARRRSGNMA